MTTSPNGHPPDPVGAAEREVGQFIYRRIEVLMDAKAGTPDGFELSYLAQIVADVEEYDADGSEPREPFAVNLGVWIGADEREEIARIISPSAFARKRRGRLQDDINPADREHNRNRALAKADAIILAATAHLSAERDDWTPAVPHPLDARNDTEDDADVILPGVEFRRMLAEREELLEMLAIFLGEDERFQVAVGGNPIAVDRMLDKARDILRRSRKIVGGQ